MIRYHLITVSRGQVVPESSTRNQFIDHGSATIEDFLAHCPNLWQITQGGKAEARITTEPDIYIMIFDIHGVFRMFLKANVL